MATKKGVERHYYTQGDQCSETASEESYGPCSALTSCSLDPYCWGWRDQTSWMVTSTCASQAGQERGQHPTTRKQRVSVHTVLEQSNAVVRLCACHQSVSAGACQVNHSHLNSWLNGDGCDLLHHLSRGLQVDQTLVDAAEQGRQVQRYSSMQPSKEQASTTAYACEFRDMKIVLTLIACVDSKYLLRLMALWLRSWMVTLLVNEHPFAQPIFTLLNYQGYSPHLKLVEGVGTLT